MTRQEALNKAKNLLASRNIEDAALEAAALLRHALHIDRTRLYLSLQEELTSEQANAFNELLERRASGVPFAYLTGHREFFGLDFCVNEDVLIPRPETELLVEKAIDLTKSQKIQLIADIGTGSGIIAVTLASNLPEARIFAVDISEKALDVARKNAEKHDVADRITFLQGDLVQPLPIPCGLIIANLPYVKQSEIGPPISAEPRTALDGGKDGLDVIRRFCREVKNKLTPGGYVLMEIGMGQSEAVKEILTQLYPSAEIAVYQDLAEIDRVIQAKIL